MRHVLLKTIGILSLGLGIVGAFLPLMPTTCFVLLSAWCFAKASPRWYQYLLRNRIFGKIILRWETDRCIPEKARWIAITSMVVSGGLSFVMMDSTLLRVLLVIFLGAGVTSLYAFKKCRSLNSCYL